MISTYGNIVNKTCCLLSGVPSGLVHEISTSGPRRFRGDRAPPCSFRVLCRQRLENRFDRDHAGPCAFASLCSAIGVADRDRPSAEIGFGRASVFEVSEDEGQTFLGFRAVEPQFILRDGRGSFRTVSY